MGFHAPQLDIQDDRRNEVVRLALRGELDLATAPELDEHLMHLEQDGTRTVLLDLRDLTFVDSTGLHTFLAAQRRSEDNGHRLAFVGANDQLRKLLQATASEHVVDEQEGTGLLARFTQDPSSGASADADGQQNG
jgi:anti-sigma B factor antagonist